MQSLFPKLTLVAEVKNPEAFSKALDTVVIAINTELKAQAIEKEAEDKAAAEKAAPGGTPAGAQAGEETGPSGVAKQVIPSSSSGLEARISHSFSRLPAIPRCVSGRRAFVPRLYLKTSLLHLVFRRSRSIRR